MATHLDLFLEELLSFAKCFSHGDSVDRKLRSDMVASQKRRPEDSSDHELAV